MDFEEFFYFDPVDRAAKKGASGKMAARNLEDRASMPQISHGHFSTGALFRFPLNEEELHASSLAQHLELALK